MINERLILKKVEKKELISCLEHEISSINSIGKSIPKVTSTRIEPRIQKNAVAFVKYKINPNYLQLTHKCFLQTTKNS